MFEKPGISMGIRSKIGALNATIDQPGPGYYSPVRKEKNFAFS